MSFGILLDSGAVFTVKVRTKADAVAALRRWKQARRDALQRGDIVQPRQALGLVTTKPHKRERAAIADRSASAPRRGTGVARKGKSSGARSAIAQGRSR